MVSVLEKAAVLDIMQRDYGAFIMEADALAHRLMEPGQISYNDIVEHFGRDILDEDSRIDRAKLQRSFSAIRSSSISSIP